ncbi:hypothetical protein U0070_005168 [Myodes glareolus]|uniref:Large ribosomal subunit protein eL34 n=1 Tax=Myodes glareolus TaxID=447135 RepID=A0AAW0IFV4_MYOGA
MNPSSSPCWGFRARQCCISTRGFGRRLAEEAVMACSLGTMEVPWSSLVGLCSVTVRYDPRILAFSTSDSSFLPLGLFSFSRTMVRSVACSRSNCRRLKRSSRLALWWSLGPAPGDDRVTTPRGETGSWMSCSMEVEQVKQGSPTVTLQATQSSVQHSEILLKPFSSAAASCACEQCCCVTHMQLPEMLCNGRWQEGELSSSEPARQRAWPFCCSTRRGLSYNTASNKTRLSRKPGNRIVYLYTKKVGKAPKSACGVCPGRLRGVRAVRPKVFMRLSKTKKHVSQAYGGSMCAKCVCDRIKRAFLIEEQKIVVKVLKAQAESESEINYPDTGHSDPEKRKQLLNQASSSGFTDSESEVLGEESKTLGDSPGPAVSSPSPRPGHPVARSTLLSVPSAERRRFRSPGATADQLRSTRPTLPAPPGPPERGPRPRGAEGAGGAKRSDWGPPAAFASSP